MKDEIQGFQFLVHKNKAEELGKKICKAFRENIRPKQFKISIRAKVGKKFIAKEEIKSLRKDVTAKCYGGDYSRKKKLLEA